MDTNLETNLEQSVKRNSANRSVIRKSRYDYARSLGFEAKEAIVLQGWSVEKITQLAKERELKIP